VTDLPRTGQTRRRGIWVWLFNPFHYVAGGTALLVGVAVILAAGVIASLSNAHFDGVLDLHVDRPVPLWVFLLEGVIDWIALGALVLVGAKMISRSRVRTLDVLGTQALARTPTLVTALIALLPGFQRFLAHLTAQYLPGAPDVQTQPMDVLVFAVAVLAIILMTIWMVALMYRAFSVSCNVTGGKAVAVFIAALILAEALSKVAVIALVRTGAPAPPVPPVPQEQAAQTTPQDEGLAALAEAFVALLDKGDFEGAARGFDATMTQALPAPKLETAWRSLLASSGPLKRRLGVRTQKIQRFTAAFVTCEFEKTTLDVKVVFNTSKEISGLWFVPPDRAVD